MNALHTKQNRTLPGTFGRLARTGAAAFVLAFLPWAAACAQQAYPTPEAAGQAFFQAIADSDQAALRKVLGENWHSFVPTVDVDREDIYAFLAAYAKQHRMLPDGPDRMLLSAGDSGWTLPVPIVRGAGGWHFDLRQGADQMRTRRIGRNELDAMRAVLAYFDAQQEYARMGRDGSGVLDYARKFASTPGRHDGLYWPTAAGEAESPLGPIYASGRPGEGYHGYRFKILEGQGPHAPGGAYDYVIGQRMRGGFALIAWPLVYGETGVMSFMVSHDGVLYQKNLGPGTDAAARAMTRFDPGQGWTKVEAQ